MGSALVIPGSDCGAHSSNQWIPVKSKLEAAMERCGTCWKPVPEGAKFCPHCRASSGSATPKPASPTASEAKQVTRKNSVSDYVFGCGCSFLLFLVVFGVVASFFEPEKPPASQPAAPPSLACQVAKRGASLEVRHLGDDWWSNIEVTINGGLLGGGYSARAGTLGPGQTKAIPVSEFALSDGTRFDSARTKVKQVVVTADTGRGKLSYVGEFDGQP